ncbi:MAG: sulfatase [Promethearchaeota archaeon]
MRIIYFDIDTCRADHLGCYGYHRNTTPNIDKIAKEGTIFTNCYASDAPCLPSRASFFTGRFGIHTGIVGHGGTAADMRITGKEREFFDHYKFNNFPSIVKNAKFYTVSISPFAERHSAYWFYSGWNEMYNPGKRGYEIADDIYPIAEKWLRENGKKDKWFLHVNFWDPHTPYRTPMSFGNPFENDPPPSWLTEEIIQKQREDYGARSARDLSSIIYKETLSAYERIKDVPEIRDLNDFKKWIDGYDTGIRYADEHVGKIINILKELGVYEDTIIMISGDHGESQGELNVYGDHATADHIINRIPMIIKWPGKNWNKKYDDLIYQVDVAATILEGLGKRVPSFWDGKSFYKKIESGENLELPKNSTI